MKRICYLFFASVILIALSSCSGKKVEALQPPPENADYVSISDSSLALMDVVLLKPELKVIESNIYLAGKVIAIPNYRASVSTDISGKVERIFVREGSYVKKGTPLLSLRSMELIELQNQYFEAKAQMDFLALEYRRQEELIKNNIGALVDFQTTDAKYKASISKVNALMAKLQLLGFTKEFINSPEVASTVTINSPINGYIFKLPVQVGMLATTDIAMAEIVDNSELMADVYVYDKDLDNISEGQPVEIDFITHSYPSVTGTVAHISRALDPQTKAVTVHVKFSAPTGKMILPEMSIRCVVVRRESLVPQLTVTHSALLTEEDHAFVYLVFDAEKKGSANKLHKYRVTVGNQNEKEVQIKFLNEPAGTFKIVSKNVAIVENERKKRSGALTQ
jgi:cobalt-zinc-cadmium efflux system membrane fusion protein